MPQSNISTSRAGTGGRNVIAFTAPVEIQAAGTSDKKGAPTFSMVAYNGGPLTIKNWDYPVVIDQTGWQDLDRSRPALRDHDQSRIVGHTTTTTVEDGKLITSGVVSGKNPHAQEVIDTHAHGFPWQASVGAKVLQHEFVPEGQTASANGQEWQGPINIARRTSLREISFCPNGADDFTSAKIAATAAETSSAMTNFQQWAKAHGFDVDALDDVQMTAAKEAFKVMNPEVDPDATAEVPGDEGDDATAGATTTATASPAAVVKTVAKPAKVAAAVNDLDIRATSDNAANAMVVASRKAMVGETNRVGAIQKICAGSHQDIQAKAIGEGWTADKTELEVMRANRPNPGMLNASFGINTGKGSAVTPMIFAAACAESAGVPQKFAFEGLSDQQKSIAASNSVRAASSSIYGMFAAVAAAHGRRLPAPRMTDDVIRAGFEIEKTIQADGGTGFSTMSVAGLTENVMNKQMLAAYSSVQTVVPQIAYETSVNDFKPWKRYRLTSGGGFEPIGPAGELKHGALADESYTGQARTQGKLIAITRELMINDDMGALVQVPQTLGRDGVIARERAVIAALVAGTSTAAPGPDYASPSLGFNFLSTGANNMQSGAGSALGQAGLDTAQTLFLQQKDKFGNPIMVTPDRLLVPPALKTTADTLFSGANLIAGALATSGSKPVLVSTANPFASRYTPLMTPWLGSGSPIRGTTDTGWYLLPDPTAGTAAVTVGYVNNQRTPTIQRGELSFDQLGIGMRAFWDFGVAIADYRCVVFSAGQ